MGLVKFHTSTNLAEMAVLKSELDAAGIYNFIQTYHYGTLDALALIALGGQAMLINESDVEYANAFLNAREETKDYETPPIRKFGQWKRATFFALCFGYILPLYFLKAVWLLVIAGVLILISTIYLFTDNYGEAAGFLVFASGFGFIGLLLFHAEKVALPRIRNQNHVPERNL